MPQRRLIAILTIAAIAACITRTAAADEPAAGPYFAERPVGQAASLANLRESTGEAGSFGHAGLPQRYLRSPQLLDTARTAAAPTDDSRHLPVVTANAMREIPGTSRLSETIASGDPPPPMDSSAAAPDAAAADAITTTANVDRTFSLILGGCLAGLALLIGLWLRIRQSPAARQDIGAAGTDTPQAVAAACPPEPAEDLNPLEALIRNELAVVEEPVQIPAHLEFYGWPAVSAATRRDPAHAVRKTDQPTAPALAGPHFLRRRRAVAAPDPSVASHANRGHRRRAAVSAGASADADQRRVGEPRPQSESDRAGELSGVPGPLDRALERLLRKQT